MTRRKSVCSKWTLVSLIVLVTLCQSVCSRPQDSSTVSSPTSLSSLKPTDAPIRYKNGNSYSKPSVVIGNFNSSLIHNSLLRNDNKTANDYNKNNTNNLSSKSRAIYDYNRPFNNNIRNRNNHTNILPRYTKNIRKKPIKRVVTKWKDEVKYEDLDFTYETTTSDEDGLAFTNLVNSNDYTSTEHAYDHTLSKKQKRPQTSNKLYNKLYNNNHYGLRPQYSDETQVYSDNVHIIDSHSYLTRPPYVFTTPSPTPIITNVGYPSPWPLHTVKIKQKTTTQKPLQTKIPLKDVYNYHNSVHNYPGNFEVTTFQPSAGHTERIVIRPEEYSAVDDCPTIYLTLNNTFQGQAKEACPDLNIAVNTNVINKNVVVESEEDNDSIFSDGFGLPLGEDSGANDASTNDYFESDENQEHAESASVEATGMSSYSSPNAAIQSEATDLGDYASPSSHLSAITRPGRPSKDDDDFSFSSMLKFFRPALNALGWLATLNPITFGLFPLLLTPLAFLFAGSSGLAALFAPWLYSYGREAPKVVHVYRPHWHWDDSIKSWQLHSFPNNRKWNPAMSRSSKEITEGSVKPTLFYKLKEWMKDTTQKLRLRMSVKTDRNRKNKRKKRETWTRRMK